MADFRPILPETTLALPGLILYKPGLDRHLSAFPLILGAKSRPLKGRCPRNHSERTTDMAVPRRKTSPSRRGMRRSADALKTPTYVEDKDSGELRRPHHLDLKTGMYKGRQVLKSKKD